MYMYVYSTIAWQPAHASSAYCIGRNKLLYETNNYGNAMNLLVCICDLEEEYWGSMKCWRLNFLSFCVRI